MILCLQETDALIISMVKNTDQQANNEMFPKRKNEMRQKKIVAGFARYQVWFHKQHLKNIL
jgi:hypothetical protein